MKRFYSLLFISLLVFGCASDEKSGTDTLPDTAVRILPKDKTDVAITMDSTKLIGTHLSDTAVFLGDWVIFLRPDSARFEFYTNNLQEGIYEADADFGVAISTAIDTIIGNKEFKGLKAMVSTRRYIKLMDCKECPVTIDRDTVNYGVILTGTDRRMKAEQNVYGGEHYIKVIRKYFNLKK